MAEHKGNERTRFVPYERIRRAGITVGVCVSRRFAIRELLFRRRTRNVFCADANVYVRIGERSKTKRVGVRWNVPLRFPPTPSPGRRRDGFVDKNGRSKRVWFLDNDD